MTKRPGSPAHDGRSQDGLASVTIGAHAQNKSVSVCVSISLSVHLPVHPSPLRPSCCWPRALQGGRWVVSWWEAGVETAGIPVDALAVGRLPLVRAGCVVGREGQGRCVGRGAGAFSSPLLPPTQMQVPGQSGRPGWQCPACCGHPRAPGLLSLALRWHTCLGLRLGGASSSALGLGLELGLVSALDEGTEEPGWERTSGRVGPCASASCAAPPGLLLPEGGSCATDPSRTWADPEPGALPAEPWDCTPA